jgi:hypothetical protein
MFVFSTYFWVIEYLTETSKLNSPPFSTSSILEKMDGESKSGKQNQSMLPVSEINAALLQFPTTP